MELGCTRTYAYNAEFSSLCYLLRGSKKPNSNSSDSPVYDHLFQVYKGRKFLSIAIVKSQLSAWWNMAVLSDPCWNNIVNPKYTYTLPVKYLKYFTGTIFAEMAIEKNNILVDSIIQKMIASNACSHPNAFRVFKRYYEM
jgi:hypothetical protein